MLGADMAKALKPASASPNKIQLRSLFMFPSFFCAIPLPRPDTLGTEKKSGVPYILTFYRRHRQTPYYKHDQKTRHVGLAHVAQPSYLTSILLWRSFLSSSIRCCVRCWGPFGLAQPLGGERTRVTRDPTVGSEVLPYFLGRCGRRWNAVPTLRSRGMRGLCSEVVP